ncbi:MAG: 3-keto-5-aminohexanoate cleavage protein [Candidatus Sericytochromatia bacterium]|nr:3-keto-5-aminohexanoate cleavage protein [Candidatus Sericytochromatia bacterium]
MPSSPLNPDSEIIINFCPTGMIPTREMNPHVPISPQEIIEQTHEAYELGITVAHLHARLPDQSPTHEPEIYAEMMQGLHRHCPDLILCLSTSGRNVPEFEKRSAVIELYPDMCSLTLSSLNFAQGASLNSPDMIQRLLAKMLGYGVTPELECFDLGMINYGKYLIQKYELPSDRIYWNLLFGNIFGAQTQLSQMGAMLDQIPPAHWLSVGGLGDYQLQAHAIAIASGRGVRVGLEDNLWLDRQRSRPASNLALLQRVHQLLEIHEKTCLSPRKLNLYNPRRKR